MLYCGHFYVILCCVVFCDMILYYMILYFDILLVCSVRCCYNMLYHNSVFWIRLCCYVKFHRILLFCIIYYSFSIFILYYVMLYCIALQDMISDDILSCYITWKYICIYTHIYICIAWYDSTFYYIVSYQLILYYIIFH